MRLTKSWLLALLGSLALLSGESFTGVLAQTETTEEQQEQAAAKEGGSDDDDEEFEPAKSTEEPAAEEKKPDEDDDEFDAMESEEKKKKMDSLKAAHDAQRAKTKALSPDAQRERAQTCLFVGRQHVRMDDEYVKQTVEAIHTETKEAREKARAAGVEEAQLPAITPREKALDILMISAFTRCFRKIDQSIVERYIAGGLTGEAKADDEEADPAAQAELQQALMDKTLTQANMDAPEEEAQLDEEEWNIVQQLLGEERDTHEKEKADREAKRKADLKEKREKRKKNKKSKNNSGMSVFGDSMSLPTKVVYMLVVLLMIFGAMGWGLRYLNDMNSAGMANKAFNESRRGSMSEAKKMTRSQKKEAAAAKKRF